MPAAKTLQITLLVLVVLFSSQMAWAAAEDTEEEKNNFAEEGVEYDGYLFAPLDRRIVKIPLDLEKTAENSIHVMDCPANERNIRYEARLFAHGGELYINFAEYMSHGGLYRMTSAGSVPEFVVKTTNESAWLYIMDSKTRPGEMKFFRFTESDFGDVWGELYCYFPRENIAKKMAVIEGSMRVFNFPGITNDDEVIVAEIEKGPEGYGFVRISQVDQLAIDVKTKNITTRKLLGGGDMPKVYRIDLNPDTGKLYLIGTGFWEYDLKSASLKHIVDFKKFIPDWPEDIEPYIKEWYGAPVFLSSLAAEGRFGASGDKKVVFVDVINGTYEVGDGPGDRYSW
jgi:hypothetical protein